MTALALAFTALPIVAGLALFEATPAAIARAAVRAATVAALAAALVAAAIVLSLSPIGAAAILATVGGLILTVDGDGTAPTVAAYGRHYTHTVATRRSVAIRGRTVTVWRIATVRA
jgi:hypothetical protein